MQKGSITIYLALLLSVVLSLFLSVLEEGRISAIRMKTEISMDAALYSIFAEYNRALLEQYDLFFIDSSYGSGQGSLQKVKKHFEDYANDNMKPAYEKQDILIKDLIGIEVEETEIVKYSIATDEEGIIFKRQAIDYIKDKYGLSYINKFKRQLEDAKGNNLFERDVTSEREENDSRIEGIIRDFNNKQREEKDDWIDVTLDNPADSINKTRGRGSLSFVINRDTPISNNAVNLQNYISAREPIKGDGLCNRQQPETMDKLFFYAYLFDKYGNYVHPLDKGELQYQMEYILAGKNNDMDNLKWVVNRLILLRESANIVYLFSDKAKMAQAEAFALTLSAVMTIPELTELIKMALIFAWAYAESIYDVKQLLNGERIPLIKSDSTWHYSLEGMLSFEEEIEKRDNDIIVKRENERTKKESIFAYKDGLSYSDYLLLFLSTAKEKKIIFRAMDIMEMDIRKTPGNGSFRIDGCIDYIKVEMKTKSRYRYSCTILREYNYF